MSKNTWDNGKKRLKKRNVSIDVFWRSERVSILQVSTSQRLHKNIKYGRIIWSCIPSRCTHSKHLTQILIRCNASELVFPLTSETSILIAYKQRQNRTSGRHFIRQLVLQFYGFLVSIILTFKTLNENLLFLIRILGLLSRIPFLFICSSHILLIVCTVFIFLFSY